MYNRMYNGEKGVDASKKDVALWGTREGTREGFGRGRIPFG